MAGTESELVAHRVALFYECRSTDIAGMANVMQLTFDQVAVSSPDLPWIDPLRLVPGAQRSLSGEKIWNREPLTVSHDLHPAIRSIMSGASEGEPDTASPSCYTLSDKARNLMGGLYLPAGIEPEQNRGRARDFMLNLGPKAVERLKLDGVENLGVTLEDVLFLCFRTGIGIAVIEAVVNIPKGHPTPLAVLIEAVHLLSDERRPPLLTWQLQTASTDAANAKPRQFHLSDLLRPMLKDGGYDVIGERRMFSYATVLAGETLEPEKAREVVFRLSRHYNYTYAPQMESNGTEIIEPFQNVLHGLSLEGAATVVTMPAAGSADDVAPEFLGNWIKTAYRPAYLPIVITAYHEHIALLDFAQSASIDLAFDRLAEAQVAKLSDLCHRFLAFRLRYRPALVSFITMHNQFSASLRRALGSDILSQKASQDAMEAEARLTRHLVELAEADGARARQAEDRRLKLAKAAEHRLERRSAWHGALLASLVAILAVLNFSEQLGKFFEEPISILSAEQGHVPWSEIIRWAGFTLALGCGLYGFIVSYRRTLQKNEEDGQETEGESHDEEVIDELKSDVLTERPKSTGRLQSSGRH